MPSILVYHNVLQRHSCRKSKENHTLVNVIDNFINISDSIQVISGADDNQGSLEIYGASIYNHIKDMVLLWIIN